MGILKEVCDRDAVRVKLGLYNTLKARIECDLLDLADLKVEGPQRRSADVVVMRGAAAGGGGSDLTPEEHHERRLRALERRIREGQREINRINAALGAISEDEYYSAFYNVFISGMSAILVGMEFGCSKSTLYRNLNRLLGIIETFLGH